MPQSPHGHNFSEGRNYAPFYTLPCRPTRTTHLLYTVQCACSKVFVLDRCWSLQCFDAVGWVTGRACKKTEWWGAGVVVCLEWGADLHMAQLMPLPLILSCFSKIQIGFTFPVPSHPGSPGKRAVKCVRVCVCLKHIRNWKNLCFCRPESSSEYVVSLKAFNNAGHGKPIYETTITREERGDLVDLRLFSWRFPCIWAIKLSEYALWLGGCQHGLGSVFRVVALFVSWSLVHMLWDKFVWRCVV